MAIPSVLLYLPQHTLCNSYEKGVFLSEEHQEVRKLPLFQILGRKLEKRGRIDFLTYSFLASVDISAFLCFVIMFFHCVKTCSILIWFQYIRRVSETTLVLKPLVISGKLC